MKRKYREAMRAAASRPWDTYVDGADDDALETLDWYGEYAQPYEASQPDPQRTEELPF